MEDIQNGVTPPPEPEWQESQPPAEPEPELEVQSPIAQITSYLDHPITIKVLMGSNPTIAIPLEIEEYGHLELLEYAGGRVQIGEYEGTVDNNNKTLNKEIFIEETTVITIKNKITSSNSANSKSPIKVKKEDYLLHTRR